MTEDIEYKRDNSMQEETSQWALGGVTSELSASIVSTLSHTDDDYYRPQTLRIITKKKEELDRPTIQATTEELFCFFRLYVTTIAKTQIISIFDGGINMFFWYHVQTLIFNSLPHGFVQLFLAVYVPQEHFYLNKMNPLLYGYNFLVIMAAYFELNLLVSCNIFLMDYFWLGVTRKNPWNGCLSIYKYMLDVDKLNNIQIPVNCYVLEDFTAKIKAGLAKNQTLHFHEFEYYLKSGEDKEYFQIPQIIHFAYRIDTINMPIQQSVFGIYFLIMWSMLAVHYNHFFKKYIWKILKVACYTELAISVVATIQIMLSYYVFNPYLKNVKVIDPLRDVSEVNEKLDIDMIALALNAPPVVHVLFSRRSGDPSQVQYKSLSAVLVASSWLYSFFSGIMFSYLKDYCEKIVGIKILSSVSNAYAFFYLNAIYFSFHILGNIYFNISLLVRCVSTFYLFVIIYQCLVEAIICEWKFISRIMLLAVISLLSLLTHLLVKVPDIIIMYVYTKSVALFTEIFGIYILYPLGRLIEDIVFHSGFEPHTLQIWNMRLVPIFVGTKLYLLLRVIWEPEVPFFITLFWYTPAVFFVAGMIYALYKYVIRERRSWVSLFCPDPYWGPADYYKRRCRKMFKGHEYIGSQTDRMLSRYMLAKTESDVYSLDVRYDSGRRSTDVSYAARMQHEDEKKYV